MHVYNEVGSQHVKGDKMIGKKALLMSAALAIVPCMAAYGAQNGASAKAVMTDELSSAETEDLLFMREEEKMARDVYDELYEYYQGGGVSLLIFARIAESEQTHMDSMLKLLDKYGLDDPAEGLLRGEFENPALTSLYLNLVSDSESNSTVLNEPTSGGKVSVMDALYVGAWIEERDMVDIMHAISNTDKADIARVYTSLLCGSRSHLRAFVDQIGEDEYEAQILLKTEDAGPEAAPEETLAYWLGSDSDEVCF